MSEPRTCELLRWDSEFFGYTVARLSGVTTSFALRDADRWCRERGVRVAYLHLAENAVGLVPDARAGGFALVDERLEYACRPEQAAIVVEEARDVVVRPYEPRDLPALERIAARAHRDSRFYADVRFPREQCDALYVTWIRRDCGDPDTTVLVAEHREEAVGYVAVREDAPARALIDLIAVDERHRGRNIGALLGARAIRHAIASGAQRVTVATQARNVAARRLYERLGMAPEATTFWLHKWYDPLTD